MNTYHKVTTRVTDRRCTIVYSGEVQAETCPHCTFKASAKQDIYEDYFLTKEEAELFIRTQRASL